MKLVLVTFSLCSLLVGGGSGLLDCGYATGWPVPAPPAGLALRQVNAIIRHGDRTPWTGDLCWPEDSSIWECHLTSGEFPMQTDTPYPLLPRIHRKIYSFGDETLHGNCSVGQLTSIGFKQHVYNGMNLAKAYVNGQFLSTTLNTSQLYIRSDDVSRTLMSAQSLLLGLYPPSLPVTHTETVEIHTMDSTYEYMVANPKLCPMYGNYSRTFNTSSAWQAHHPSTVALLADILKLTGYNISESNLDHYADCLRTHRCHNLALPKGMTDDLYDRVWAELSWQFYNLYKYPSVQANAKAGIGFLLKEIWQNMNAIVGGKEKQKFLLYSGHDTTLMPILSALQVDDGVWAPYASMILVELYEDTTKPVSQNAPAAARFSVRLIYNGKVLTPPFCKSGSVCDYQELSTYLSTVTPSDDYSKECALQTSEIKQHSHEYQWNF